MKDNINIKVEDATYNTIYNTTFNATQYETINAIINATYDINMTSNCDPIDEFFYNI